MVKQVRELCPRSESEWELTARSRRCASSKSEIKPYHDYVKSFIQFIILVNKSVRDTQYIRYVFHDTRDWWIFGSLLKNFVG